MPGNDGDALTYIRELMERGEIPPDFAEELMPGVREAEAARGDGHLYVQALMKLAEKVASWGDEHLGNAERALREARAAAAAGVAPGEYDAEYATATKRLAAFLVDDERYAEAEPLLREAVELDARSMAEDDPNRVPSLFGLATALSLLGAERGERYKGGPHMREAEDLWRRALTIVETNPAETNSERRRERLRGLALALAALLGAQGRLREAEEFVQRLVALGGEDAKNAQDVREGAVALALRGAEEQWDDGKPEEAARAAWDFLTLLSEPPWDAVAGRDEVVQFLLDVLESVSMEEATGNRGRLDGLPTVEELLRAELERKVRLLGEQHEEHTRMMLHLARVMEDEGRLDEAEDLLRRALPIVGRTRGEMSRRYADVLTDLADVLRKRGKRGQAKTLAARAAQLRAHLGARFRSPGSRRHKPSKRTNRRTNKRKNRKR